MAQQNVLFLLAVLANTIVWDGRAVFGVTADLTSITICLQLSASAAVLEPARSFATSAVAICPEAASLFCLAFATALLCRAGGNATLDEIGALVVVAPEDGRRVCTVLARPTTLSKALAGTVLVAGDCVLTPRTGAGKASGHARRSCWRGSSRGRHGRGSNALFLTTRPACALVLDGACLIAASQAHRDAS